MIALRSVIVVLALGLATGMPAASLGQSIRWEVDSSGTTSGVSVIGLPHAPADPASALTVRLVVRGSEDVAGPGMLGSYRVEGDSLRFTPRYPFDRGRTYQATYRRSIASGLEIRSTRLIPKPTRPSTVVTGISPSTSVVPENLLKFYLSFSSPMSRGEVYDRVRLLKVDGTAVDLPFLRLAEELWDPTGRRLTLLIDPGRIKRGLKPREEAGPVLEAGRSYTLVIDKAWPDAEGDPLERDVRKPFRAAGSDEVQPDPKRWTIARPSASTLAPLSITFPEPLDRALLESALMLVDPKGEPVEGRLAVEADETCWRFTPERPWASGTYQLVVDADLEDLCGNSILRPFEVDVQRDTPSRPEAQFLRLPIAIEPAR